MNFLERHSFFTEVLDNIPFCKCVAPSSLKCFTKATKHDHMLFTLPMSFKWPNDKDLNLMNLTEVYQTEFFLSHLVKKFFFVWFDSLCAINNLSVKQGWVFLFWLRINVSCSRATRQWRWWGSNLWPLSLESSTLPLSHCAPYLVKK